MPELDDSGSGHGWNGYGNGDGYGDGNDVGNGWGDGNSSGDGDGTSDISPWEGLLLFVF